MKSPIYKVILRIFLCSFLVILPVKLISQVTVEANAGIGGTITNVENWAGISLHDWGNFGGGFNAQVHRQVFNRFHVGAEAGFRYFLWYELPAASSYGDIDVDAFYLMAKCRYFFNDNIHTEIGIGPYFFGDFIDIGLAAVLGYRIMINRHISIVPKLGTGIIIDSDASLIPINLTIGASYKIW